MKRFPDDPRYVDFLNQPVALVENTLRLSEEIKPDRTIFDLGTRKYDWAVENPGPPEINATYICFQTPEEMFEQIFTHTPAFAGNYQKGINPQGLRIFAAKTKQSIAVT